MSASRPDRSSARELGEISRPPRRRRADVGPAISGTPTSQRGASFDWDELVNTAHGLASTTMDRSRVIGRLSLGR